MVLSWITNGQHDHSVSLGELKYFASWGSWKTRSTEVPSGTIWKWSNRIWSFSEPMEDHDLQIFETEFEEILLERLIVPSLIFKFYLDLFLILDVLCKCQQGSIIIIVISVLNRFDTYSKESWQQQREHKWSLKNE